MVVDDIFAVDGDDECFGGVNFAILEEMKEIVVLVDAGDEVDERAEKAKNPSFCNCRCVWQSSR